ncbi:MAG: N-acetyltransferase [Psychroflexus sp.]|nr:N-acetyltransferase [Psychroflexus sp. S27]
MKNQNSILRKNEFQRQFEMETEKGLISLEYQEHARQIFLTKLNLPSEFDDQNLVDQFLKEVLSTFDDERISVMPTSPEVAKFFKKNRNKYKNLLPAGISI